MSRSIIPAADPPSGDSGSDGAIETILKRDRIVIIVALVVLSLVSWGYLFYDEWRMRTTGSCCKLAEVDLRHWLSLDLLLLFVMWSIMMVAMMAPTAAPMVLTFASVNRRRRQSQKPYVSTGFFLLGYLLAWTLFSAVATAAQWALHGAALLSPTMVSTSAALGAGILIAAGIFQLTPLKNMCLSHCRDPLSFIMTEWREGGRGAILMGLRHGGFCLGCCWILMLLLFVTGVMNLLWVGIITVFVLLEKIAPAPRWISRISGLAMIAWGLWILKPLIH
jgi:predicted metal-binding membrane protein